MTYDERIAEIEKQLSDLKAEIQNPPGQYVPKNGEKYFYHDSLGKVYRSSGDDYVKESASIGNCFRTEQEAEFVVERMRVLSEMRKYAKGFKPDWADTTQCKYLISVVPYGDNRLFIITSYVSTNCGAPVIFATHGDAQACIDGIGKDRMLKYYFCEEANP